MDNGLICGPGGHIEKGETSRQAAIREAQEEFNITPKQLFYLGRMDDLGDEYCITDLYLCRDYEGDIKADEDEMQLAMFVPFESLQELQESQNKLFPPFAESLKHIDKSETALDDGNTGLPFGLCKSEGIELPDGATPEDAWEALKGKGITPENAYKEASQKSEQSEKQSAEKKPENLSSESAEKSTETVENSAEGGIISSGSVATASPKGNIKFKPKKIDPRTYLIPPRTRIKMGSRILLYEYEITITEAMTIVPANELRDQVRLANNYNMKPGSLRKKSGRADLEIKGKIVNKEVHWIENKSGDCAGLKIIMRKGG